MKKKDITQISFVLLFILAFAFRIALFYLDCKYSTDTQMIFPYN